MVSVSREHSVYFISSSTGENARCILKHYLTEGLNVLMRESGSSFLRFLGDYVSVELTYHASERVK